jgi:hypothetical protein
MRMQAAPPAEYGRSTGLLQAIIRPHFLRVHDKMGASIRSL